MDRRAMLVIGGAAVVTGGVFIYTPPQLNPDAGMNSGVNPLPNPDASPSTSVSTITSSNNPTPNKGLQSRPPKRHTNNDNGENVITGVEIETEKSDNPTTVSSSPTSKNVTPSQSATPTVSSRPTVVATPTPVVKPTPTPTPPPPPPVTKSVNGTFTGDAINVSYGIVQVRITVTNNQITDAQAIQAPTGGKSGSISNSAIPILRQETLAAQSAAIRGVSGASFTSNGWIRSLTTAISRAGI